MAIKLVAAFVAILLVLAYLAQIVLKLKDVALGIVIVIGLALMLVDLVHSLRKGDS